MGRVCSGGGPGGIPSLIYPVVLPRSPHLPTFPKPHQHSSPHDRLEIVGRAHVAYLEKGLASLPGGFASLDASRPWLCYWMLHSLALLGQEQTIRRVASRYPSVHRGRYIVGCSTQLRTILCCA